MCSIIGYYGNEIASTIIVKGLKRMEYRGYDSVGVATESNSQIELKKGTGKVNEVNSKIHLDSLPGKIGMGIQDEPLMDKLLILMHIHIQVTQEKLP